MLCSYGCGQEGRFTLKNGKVCCSKSQNSCPEIRRKIGSKLIGIPKTENHKKKLSEKKKGTTGYWRNKKRGPHSKEWNEKISKAVRENPDIEKFKKIQRDWMLLNGSRIRKLIKNPSKQELKLREIVKKLYPKAENTYKVLENRSYEVDNALLEYKIVIEYDGWYHFDVEEHRKYHKKRQQEIEMSGWKFIRYTMFDKFPTLEQVKKDVQKILKKNRRTE